MVQANELRIGNYISLNSKQVIVKDIPYLIDDNKEGYLINEVWADEYEHIPITPEILEKCGFEKHGRGYFGEGSFLFNQLNFEFYKSELYLCECIEGSFVNSKPIKHLHQLQNLYFALTGEELTVNFSTP